MVPSPEDEVSQRVFERVKWKQGADGVILDKEEPLATHASDAGGYPIVCTLICLELILEFYG